MRSPAKPFALLLVVAAATFGLAQWHPFSPAAPAAGAQPVGDATRGATTFATSCAGCHGADASGGAGPALAGSGLTAEEVASVVASGRGAMPAGIVTGQDAADVAAYVASLSE
jgi:mono/diheme cytochrome c family protein